MAASYLEQDREGTPEVEIVRGQFFGKELPEYTLVSGQFPDI